MAVQSSQTSVGTTAQPTAPLEPSGFVIYPADSYFDVSQIEHSPRPSDAADSRPAPKQPSPNQQSETLDNTDYEDMNSQQQQYEELGLTGNIISATAHLPWTVGVTKDGKIELAPRSGGSVLHDSLSYLSSSTQWHHTIVGWTGEVLQAHSPKFTELLKQSNMPPRPTSPNQGRLGNVTIHDPDGASFKDAFKQHLKCPEPDRGELVITKDHRRELETLLQHVFKNTIIPVWLGDWSEDQDSTLVLNDQLRWERYADDEFHKKLDGQAIDQKYEADRNKMFEDYRRLNEAVAHAILKVYMPGDIIWISDHHLMLLPGIIRRKLPSAYISYFHHSEWCPKEALVELPEHEEILKGLLGASVIGLPSGGLRHYVEDYFREQMGLASSGDGLLETSAGLIKLVNVPTDVDVAGVQQAAFEDESVNRHMSSIRSAYQDKKIIVARARLDRPKACIHLLEAYEYLLDHSPELQQQVVLFMITTPDRDIDQRERAIVDREVALRVLQINSKWSSTIHQPVLYHARPLQTPEHYALLRLADVGLVTSDHENINTLSMGFVVCQQEKCSPLLIAERSLKEPAESDVPTSARDAATEMRNCLLMTDGDKRNKHKALFNYFSKHDVTTFTDEFLTKARRSFIDYSPAKDAPLLDMKALTRRYREAPRRLFMFDYDGTLTPIVDDPDHALPTERLLTTLPKLAGCTENAVWIISGRSRVFLEKHFGELKNVGLSAEHGSFVRKPGSTEWENLAATMDMGWKIEVEKVFSDLVSQCPGSWIERKEVAMVWHYRNAPDHDVCLAKAVAAKALLEGERVKGWDVEVMLGKANVEVRPRFLNKGVMAANLIIEAFGKEENGWVLCAGDDTTDEGKFSGSAALGVGY